MHVNVEIQIDDEKLKKAVNHAIAKKMKNILKQRNSFRPEYLKHELNRAVDALISGDTS